MMMDIASPAELLRVEQARFGDGRRQAYLTFLNEFEDTLTALSGRIILLDENGGTIEKRVVSFSGLTAKPRESFVCHLALDGYPEFDRMEMAVESASFLYAKAWNTSPARVIDCTPPPLEAGPARVALVALAGYDAACFPEKHSTHWICVCGRFNRLRWLACRRCGRPRDEILQTLTPDQVVSEYEAQVDASLIEKQERLKQRAEENRIRKQKEVLTQRAKQDRKRLMRRRVIGIVAGLLAVTLVCWGALQLWGSGWLSGGDSAAASAKASLPPVDYLEPIR